MKCESCKKRLELKTKHVKCDCFIVNISYRETIYNTSGNPGHFYSYECDCGFLMVVDGRREE